MTLAPRGEPGARMRGQKTAVGDNAAFVTLMRVAQEDADVRKTLMAILGQSPFHRKFL